MFPSPMADGHFADAKSLRRREHRHKPMQLAVQPNFVHYLSTVGFEPTVVIVQPHTHQRAHEPVEYPGWPDFVPRIVSLAFPAADDVVSLIDFREQVGDL